VRIALIGLPNCGKSTLFNQVAGYKAETGNFSGTTVTFTESRVRVAGDQLEDPRASTELRGTKEEPAAGRVRVRDLTAGYRGVPVLRKVDLEVVPGDEPKKPVTAGV